MTNPTHPLQETSPSKEPSDATPSESQKPATRRRSTAARGQKRVLKRTISEDLIPLEEETWLLQPIAVTMMRHDYSLIQVRILVTIVENLQTILHKLLNNRNPQELSIFKSDELDEDGRMPIKMPYRQLGVDPNHYPQLRNSLKMLASIPVEIPYKTAEGRKYTKATNLCDVYIPEDTGYSKYAILKIDRNVAERLVSLDFGYHRLGKQIVFACKNRYTQRIYMFIESWVDRGQAIIKTIEFRKMLRLENNYKKFSDLCRRVLEPARQELQELALNGFCDCYFTYEKKYREGRKSGEPDELIFNVISQKNKINRQLEQLTEQQRRQFADLLMRHFRFTPSNAEKLAQRLNAEVFPLAMQKLVELRQRATHANGIMDMAAYTYKSIEQIILDHRVPNTVATEVK